MCLEPNPQTNHLPRAANDGGLSSISAPQEEDVSGDFDWYYDFNSLKTSRLSNACQTDALIDDENEKIANTPILVKSPETTISHQISKPIRLRKLVKKKVKMENNQSNDKETQIYDARNPHNDPELQERIDNDHFKACLRKAREQQSAEETVFVAHKSRETMNHQTTGKNAIATPIRLRKLVKRNLKTFIKHSNPPADPELQERIDNDHFNSCLQRAHEEQKPSDEEMPLVIDAHQMHIEVPTPNEWDACWSNVHWLQTRRCAVVNCVPRYNLSKKRFFQFPQEGPLLNKWLAATQLHRSAGIRHMLICSEHFNADELVLVLLKTGK